MSDPKYRMHIELNPYWEQGRLESGVPTAHHKETFNNTLQGKVTAFLRDEDQVEEFVLDLLLGRDRKVTAMKEDILAMVKELQDSNFTDQVSGMINYIYKRIVDIK